MRKREEKNEIKKNDVDQEEVGQSFIFPAMEFHIPCADAFKSTS